MRDMNERPVCHRAEDLVTYLYGEANEAEALDFRNHLRQCDSCHSEFTVFNQVHDSIEVWRNEAHSPFGMSGNSQRWQLCGISLPSRPFGCEARQPLPPCCCACSGS